LIGCSVPAGTPNVKGSRLVAALPVLLSLLLPGLLGSCRFVRPLQKAGPGATAPEMVKPEGFFEAATRGDLARVRELAEADPQLLEMVDEDGWDALSYAAWHAQQQVHAFLLRQGAEGNLFTEAALGPWESFHQRLETNPIGVASRDTKQKATPLIWAVRTGNQAGCELLFSLGADVAAADRNGNSVIHHAVATGKLDLMDTLLSAGADVDSVNNRGQSALHLATSAGDFAACQLLLDRGASLDLPDNAGNTPLHIAARAGNLELCEYFLFLGAQPSLENAEGRTPLDLAAEQGHDRVARLLEAQTR